MKKKMVTLLGISIITAGIVSSVYKESKKIDLKTFDKIADSTYRKFENTLTLHVISSPYGINWKGKPRDVLLNILKNQYFFPNTRRSLGHVTTELNCSFTDDNGKRVSQRFIGGQGSKHINQFSKMIRKDGVGFSILNSPMQYLDLPQLTVKGHFESFKDLAPEYNSLIFKDNKMAFLTYRITSGQCLKMRDFFLKYKEATKETKDSANPLAGNNYGFGADPLKLEGAGCALFAEAFFRLAGREEESKLFKQTVYIKENQLGDPENGKEASLIDLLLSTDQISKNEEGKRKFTFPDTDLMYKHAYMLKSDKNYNPNALDVRRNLSFGDSKALYVVIDLNK